MQETSRKTFIRMMNDTIAPGLFDLRTSGPRTERPHYQTLHQPVRRRVEPPGWLWHVLLHRDP